MEFAFMDMIAWHEARYPRMEIQDYVKLAYQNEFGPRHLAEKSRLYGGIQTELTEISGQKRVCAAEAIGNGLSRLSLCCLPHPETDGQLIADLMILTMEEHRGDREDFEEKLQELEKKLGAGAKNWLDDYRADGCPPVSHSDTYRNAYEPHYRVLKTEYTDWFPVLSEIAWLLHRQPTAVISIDGRCGSGKSTLAALIEKVFSCNVFHMDDFYLPVHRRSHDWETIPAGNMDLERFRDEVLQQVKEGKDVMYRPFNCQTGKLAEPSVIKPASLTVIEGSYSQHPVLADGYDRKVFLTCGQDVQSARLTKREGDGVRSFFCRWIPMEEGYFAAFAIEKNCDITLDTGRFR